jgi:hypothetical protein
MMPITKWNVPIVRPEDSCLALPALLDLRSVTLVSLPETVAVLSVPETLDAGARPTHHDRNPLNLV